MDERDRHWLEALIEHAEAAIGYAQAGGRDWWQDRRTVDAVLMRISQVGEAASRTSPEVLAMIPEVDWRSVKASRSKIVHDYLELDVLIIRGIVSRQLPKLVSATRQALERERTNPAP
jgi:uncharacterized protein with HEPN domain